MNIQDIDAKVQRIRETVEKGDWHRARMLEDHLYWDVLGAIADDEVIDPGRAATAALIAAEIMIDMPMSIESRCCRSPQEPE